MQECLSLEGSKAGLQSRLAEQEANIGQVLVARSAPNCSKRFNLTLLSFQLKANLLRTTLAKQSLEGEKKELLRKLEEEKGEQARDDEARRSSLSSVHYTEELAVARDAIANLRVSFSEADPNQHILDTLEQCVSVIVEKLVRLYIYLISLHLTKAFHIFTRESRASQAAEPPPWSQTRLHPQPRPRSSTSPPAPSLPSCRGKQTLAAHLGSISLNLSHCSLPRAVGQVTLRDFKQLFDRPGFFRYHFKTMDKEFGMVKEEVILHQTQ